ncbi:MAG: methionyl-tRNA formyltransferase [Patescibacteria group bacterium]
MNSLSVVFFGSFQFYSVQVLEALNSHFSVVAVITTPPRPAGRHLKLTPTEVALYAEKHHIPVYPLDNLDNIPTDLATGGQERGGARRSPAAGRRARGAARRVFSSSVTALAPGDDGEIAERTLTERAKGELREAPPHRPDFLVVAGYGKLIPPPWLSFPKVAPVNMHPSLLPYYRGRCPVEWAILKGETQTGVTLVEMSPEFDKGKILAQKAMPITPADTRQILYHKLYDLGGQLLVETLPQIAAGRVKPQPQPPGKYFYARQITREDGFVPWKKLKEAMDTGKEADYVERQFRALHPWPGLWTEVEVTRDKQQVTSKTDQRLKVLSCHMSPVTSRLSLDFVQLEGKKPVSFNQFVEAYL